MCLRKFQFTRIEYSTSLWSRWIQVFEEKSLASLRKIRPTYEIIIKHEKSHQSQFRNRYLKLEWLVERWIMTCKEQISGDFPNCSFCESAKLARGNLIKDWLFSSSSRGVFTTDRRGSGFYRVQCELVDQITRIYGQQTARDPEL